MSKTPLDFFLERSAAKTVRRIHSNDLQNLISAFFGFEYDVCSANSLERDSLYEYTVGKKNPYDEEAWNDFICGLIDDLQLGEILNGMCRQGAIPECELLVATL